MFLKISIITILVIFLIHVPSIDGQYSSLETDNVRLVMFGGAQSYLLLHTARCFENAYRYHSKFWNYKSREKVTVLLHDLGDYGNAGANSIPWNRVSMGIAPLSFAYETAPANERINNTMNHELTHIIALDKKSAKDNFFRTLFWGKVDVCPDNPVTMLYGYLTSPRRSAPVWYHEGIAVFMETWMSGGYGRALGAYDEMVFRTKVRDSAHIYSRMGLESEGTKIDFQVGVNNYLYGTRFFSFLALKYGPEKLINWVSRSKGSRAYYASQFKHVFGIRIDDEWDEWISWEIDFQKSNLDSIRLYPGTEFRVISGQPLGSISRSYLDNSENKLYTAVNYPGQVAHLASIDLETGKVYKLQDIKGPAIFWVTSLAFDSAGKTLFYTTDNSSWRDILAYDLETGKTRTLQKDTRIGDLVYNRVDSSLWGVRHFNGISTIVRIPYPYTEWNQVYSFPYGKDIYDIDISSDGKYISGALAEISGRQTLILIKIENLSPDNINYRSLFDFDHSVPANFVFSENNRYLYGSSYYTGVSNIFRYDIKIDSMDALSNCETGFFRPLPMLEDSLVVMRYTGKGFIPVMIGIWALEDVSATTYLGQMIVEKYPVVKEWMIGSPASINIDSLTTATGEYHAFSSIGIGSAYPVVEGYKEFPAYGMRFNFADPIGFHNSDITVSYSPNTQLPEDERWHVGWNYSHMDWGLSFDYNGADFYDLFGPTKASRKGYSLAGSYSKTLLFDPPKTWQIGISLAGYWGLEKLPDAQNISTSYDNFASGSFRLAYDNLSASLGAVDFEKGIAWRLLSSGIYVLKKYHPKFVTNLHYGILLPWSHSSVWLRASVGYSPGDRFEPFANFFFGGFGNNWVDNGAISRFRDYRSFPGVELNTIAGINYGRLLMEWDLPPIRFRKLGTPSFYCTWVRLALFSSVIASNVDDNLYRRELLNVGSQLDIRITMMSHWNLTFSVGYARAFEEYRKPVDEFMFSLKVL